MKVGLVIYGSLETISGGYVYDRMLVNRLRETGHTVQILSLPPRGYWGHTVDNLKFRSPEGLDILLQDELNHASLLLSNTREHKFPIISIVHNLRSSEPRASWRNAIYREIERLYLRSVDGFVFNSEATRKSVEAVVPARKTSVVAWPGGDRLGAVTPDEASARAREAGPLRLVFVANVARAKGLDVLLKALAQLPPTDYVLDIVGSGDVEPAHCEAMRRWVARAGLSVIFQGSMGDDQLKKQLTRSQVLVVPSYYEGFGIAYLEGMAHGMPAIGTTAGGIGEVITDGVDGYLIRPGDSDTLAGHLHRLGNDRSLLVRLSLAALRSYESRPTWRQSTEAIVSFLTGVVGNYRSNST